MSLSSRPLRAFQFRPALPGDKSITHRAVILGALARGESRVEQANPGDDCRATVRAVEALGVRCERREDTIRLVGTAGRLHAPTAALDLGNSGTGLRLLLGALAAHPFAVTLTGDASLRRRPVERVLDPLRRMGARADAPGDHPPVSLTGASLRGIRHTLSIPSAQVKSALLLAGLQGQGETWVGGATGTRDHTERMLRAFGVSVGEGDDWVSVQGGQALSAATVRVPGDFSAAVFYLVAAGVCPGSRVTVEGVGLNPTRTKALDVLIAMGLQVEILPDADSRDSANEPRGRLVVEGGTLRGFEIAPREVPWLLDELPALAVAAAFAEGRSRLNGASELRVKESDRIQAMADGLRAIGARVIPQDDGWVIEGSGGELLPGGQVRSQGDHRVAMALLVAGFRTRNGVEVTDPPRVETSDPLFPINLKELEELAA